MDMMVERFISRLDSDEIVKIKNEIEEAWSVRSLFNDWVEEKEMTVGIDHVIAIQDSRDYRHGVGNDHLQMAEICNDIYLDEMSYVDDRLVKSFIIDNIQEFKHIF